MTRSAEKSEHVSRRRAARRQPGHVPAEKTSVAPYRPQGSRRRHRLATGEQGITVDQIAAKQIGLGTPLPSLEICGEPGGYSSLSYRTPTQRLPMEGNPRKTFYGLFGQGDTNEERRAVLSSKGSLLRPRA